MNNLRDFNRTKLYQLKFCLTRTNQFIFAVHCGNDERHVAIQSRKCDTNSEEKTFKLLNVKKSCESKEAKMKCTTHFYLSDTINVFSAPIRPFL